jgi:hypothetical protein
MSGITLKNGVRRRIASLPEEGSSNGENTVAVSATGASLPWVLRFWARLGRSSVYIGAVRIFASQENRLVAICSIPGAREFEVEGQAQDGAVVDEIAVDFEGIDARGGPWGVHAIRGNSVDGSRSYRVITGTVGAVTVTGEVFGWAAWTTQAGGTIAVAALPALGFGPIDVPQNGAINGNAMGLLAPVSTWTFTNTDGYSIEYVPPGSFYDG